MGSDLPGPRVIARADDWTLEAGRYGPRLVLTTEWSEAASRAWKGCGARELELNYAKGWRRGDLSFLTDLPDLLSLSIIDWNLEDASVVNRLASLRHLQLFTCCGTEIRFDRLPRLESCVLEWRPKAKTLFGHIGIRKLYVDRLDAGGDLRPLAGMTALRSLELDGPRLNTLDGVGAVAGLERLEIGLARRLGDIEELGACAALTWLELASCRKISDVSSLSALRELRVLRLGDLGEIASIRPLSRLRKLEKLFLLESTNVLDGDLSPLLALPRLEHVSFVDRSHYSHRGTDFPEMSTEEVARWRARANRELDRRILGAAGGGEEMDP